MEKPQLPADINPDNFPAKLWRLANSPRFPSICWDARGQGLIIHQPQFEREVLGAGPGSHGAPGATGLFKTRSFASLTRQFNLYGFRKLAETSKAAGVGSGGDGGSSGPLHHFCSPYFVRDHPDLLVHMKRLTKANKAKLAAGLEVKSRPPTAYQQLLVTLTDQDPLLLPPAPGEANGPGLLTLQQLHQPYHQANYPTGLLTLQQLHQPYHQANYPTATLQLCSPPAHTDPLTGCASPAASMYTHCSFFQISMCWEIQLAAGVFSEGRNRSVRSG
ncbi:heat shock factor protein 5 isoform X2 [Athene noctua]|uniref:heat shock factor protein 5 isoform X2 n=1 Tax=Athene noctua TaxID=126797 RepID=UPI003EC0FA9D